MSNVIHQPSLMSSMTCGPLQLVRCNYIVTLVLVFLEILTKKQRDVKLLMNDNSLFLDDIWTRELAPKKYQEGFKTLLQNCFNPNMEQRCSTQDAKESVASILAHASVTQISRIYRGHASRRRFCVKRLVKQK